jgi:CubicO group peptidase (beta-lactamase class C family)
VGTKRIYSTYGYELALKYLSDDHGPTFLVSTMNSALGTAVESDGTAGGGLLGSLQDLLTLAREWSELSRSADEWVTPFLPEISGIVPGFGPFTPNPWGLGPEIKGDKQHWMGRRWSAESFGHFGQSGSLFLIDPVAQLGVVALSRIPFGAWAVSLFGEWTDEVWEMWR